MISLEKQTLRNSAKMFLPDSISIALDAGGHRGYNLVALLGRLPKVCLINLDIDKRALLHGHERIDLHLQADCTSIPLRDEVVDLIVCSEVLEHIRYPKIMVSELARVLRIGGIVALSTPSKNIFRSIYFRVRRRVTNHPHALYEVSDEHLEEFLAELGNERWLHHFHEGFAPSQLTRLFAEYGLQIVHMDGVIPRFFTRYLPFKQHIGMRGTKMINRLAKADRTIMFLMGDIIIIARKR